jgi:predicted hotdog family 3-hydroxylacyl-ACP dehydratase
MALVTKENIFDYIPQRDPICLVHTIYECTETGVKTGFMIEPDHYFVSDGKLMEAGVIENLAQSCAAHSGYFSRQSGQPPKVGFIANIKNLEVYFCPAPNSEIITEVTIANRVLNVTLVNAHSICDGKKVASCEMRVFLQE